jgi:hypothetical protein
MPLSTVIYFKEHRMHHKRVREKYYMSTPDTRKEVWRDLAEFLAKLPDTTDQGLRCKYERELGFPITKWTNREDAISRIAYVMSKKIIEG